MAVFQNFQVCMAHRIQYSRRCFNIRLAILGDIL
jgi:hypothetical protein